MDPIKLKDADLYKACVECKRKRVICLRVRRKINMGHSNITVHETLDSGEVKTDTYGLWMADETTGSRGTNLKHNYDGDKYWEDKKAWNPKDVKCKEMDKKGEDELKKAVNKNMQYNFLTGDYCSTWSANTYNNVTGSNYSGITPNFLGNQMGTR
jgi:hypothetical protein